MIFQYLSRALSSAVLVLGFAVGSANAAVIGVNCGGASAISEGDLIVGNVVSFGGAGSCEIDLTSAEDPLDAIAAATISVGNLSLWTDLTLSWLTVGDAVLASTVVVAPSIELTTLFTAPNLIQTLAFSWSDSQLPQNFQSISFDFQVATVPVPPAILLFGSALAGIGFLSRKRRKKQPSLV